MNTLNAVLCSKLFMPHNCINYNRKYNLLMNLPMQSVAQLLLVDSRTRSEIVQTDQDKTVASEGMQDDRMIGKCSGKGCEYNGA